MGCSNDNQAASAASSTVSGFTTGGGGEAVSCAFGQPDGLCEASDRESCDCPDCMNAAKCTGGCTDDGNCVLPMGDPPGPGEDCSCSDCWQRVGNCPVENLDVGCNTDAQQMGDPAQCDSNENCTCPDCRGIPACENNCTNDSQCVPYFEGCMCADCTSFAGCMSGPVAASSTVAASTAAAGGAGGVGGSGGAGGN